ncbi:MAG: hypothetical protein M1457_11925 [bacterium]|nr:hypothetical protein [bacterium]
MLELLLFIFLMIVGGFFSLLVLVAVGFLKLIGLALGGAFGLARALAIIGLVVIVFMLKGVLLFLLLAAGAGLLIYGACRLLFGGGGRREAGYFGDNGGGGRVIDVGRRRTDESAYAAFGGARMRDRLRRMEERLMNLETILGKGRGF